MDERKEMDKIRAHREELKRLWFSLDRTNTPVKKEITVEMNTTHHWKGYGIVRITSDGPDGFSQFSTHEEYPMKYAKDRMKQEKYKEYKLIVK